MPRTRVLGLAATFALLAGCGGGTQHPRTATVTATPTAAATHAPDGPRLVVVGDSLAFGRFADTQAEAFPQLVATALHSRLQVLAAPGVTTGQLGAQAAPARGDEIVVEAGTNDFLLQTPRRRFADDYRALLGKVTAASPGAKLVCLTIWMPKDIAAQQPAKIPPSFYDATIRRACRAGSVVDVSALADQSGMRGPAGRSTAFGTGDDFHPNSVGHAAIARLIEARLHAAAS
jgi:acyl-CoA thioesterase-1